EILVRHAGGAQDDPRVELGARLGCPDRNLLPLQIGQRLDSRIGARNDLDVVRIDGGDAAQFFQRRLESGFFIAFPGIRQRIAEREGDLAAARLQQVEILDRGLGGLDRSLELRHRFADRIGQRHAERVVNAAGSPGQHIDELVGGDGRPGDERQRQRATDEKIAHGSSGSNVTPSACFDAYARGIRDDYSAAYRLGPGWTLALPRANIPPSDGPEGAACGASIACSKAMAGTTRIRSTRRSTGYACR